MKIGSIRIENFRSFDDETISFNDYSALVGANGAGKSTILAALNVFFREVEQAPTELRDLDEEDFHKRDTSKNIRITLTFSELSEEAKEDFSAYVRHGELVVSAEAIYDPNSGKAPVKQYGQRNVFPDFKGFFELEKSGGRVADLKQEYLNFRLKFMDLPDVKTKADMITALRDYEEKRPDECELIQSPDQFYGFSGGSDKLGKYVQWIYVPAVKDVTQENTETKNNFLGKILKRAVRSKVSFDEIMLEIRSEAKEKYQEALKQRQPALDDISQAISKRLGDWAHPGASARIEWAEDEIRSVNILEPSAKLLAIEGGFEGDIARFGHGFQRCYLLALLQELAGAEIDGAPNLILGLEEPELYQHPPQARHLADILWTLTHNATQVFVTTHSPYFVSGRHFEDVFVVRKDPKLLRTSVTSVTMEKIADRMAAVKKYKKPLETSAQAARLEQTLNPHLNEMFFCQRVVLVEGIEDIAFLASWMTMKGTWSRFRRAGGHLIPVGGKGNLIRPIVLLQELGIPTFVMFDADDQETHIDRRTKHEKDNIAILKLLEKKELDAFPAESVFANNFIQWRTEISPEIKSELDDDCWQKASESAQNYLGNPTGNFKKNPEFIGALLRHFDEVDIDVECLSKACERICKFVEST